MLLNNSPLNQKVLNAGSDTFLGVVSGNLISFEQKVVRNISGNLIEFEQDVILFEQTGNTNLISFEQQVISTIEEFSIINFEQTIVDQSALSHTQKFGWDIESIVIGGAVVPRNQIHGEIEITRTENDACLATFTLITPIGVQNLENYQGKSVTIDGRTSNGIRRVFTGVVDIPEIDIYEEKITLQCTDRRTEILNSNLGTIVNNLGFYSEHVFSKPKDTAELVEQRISTIPYSIDIDAYGNFNITSWTPKSTADYILNDDDVRRATPQVEYTSRGRVINNLSIQFQYRYNRFHHLSRNYSWISPINDNVCLILRDGYTLTSKAMVAAAIQQAQWPIEGEISFTDVWPSGWYTCDGQLVGWSTKKTGGLVNGVYDEDGNQLKDTNGNFLYSSGANSTFEDLTGMFCMAAAWRATTQFAQTITETHTINIKAPQSIAQYGTVTKETNHAITAESDDAAWENYTAFRTVNPGTSNYNIDQDINRTDFNLAVATALAKGRTEILGSHRDTRVTVVVDFWPEVELYNTVLIDTDEIVAKGKVWEIKHNILIDGDAKTTLTLVLSRATGSSSDDILVVPNKISDTVAYPTGTINLGNHYGEDPSQDGAESWNGFIGNRYITENNNTFKTSFTEQFIVDTPTIPDLLREEKILENTVTYNIAVPNDTLTITFDGKS